jgi:hypothetical protein
MAAADRNGPARDEYLSPELVLVDPDLGRRARQRLRDETGQPERERQLASTSARPAVAVASAVPGGGNRLRPTRATGETQTIHGRGWRRILHRAITLAVVVAGIALVAGVVVASPSEIESWLSSDERPAARPMSPSEREGPSSSHAATPAPPAQGAATRTKTQTAPAASSRTAQRPQKGKSSRSGQRTRAFGWGPAPGASLYIVDFYRGRKLIYEGRVSKPRLMLPEQWRFRGRRYRLSPGRYRWDVRAVLRSRPNGRAARVVVRATLRIPRPR